MAIYIKQEDMEMPTSCSNCEMCGCYTESKGEVYRCDLSMRPVRYFEKRLDCCPLIEIPSPHGRLIDADALEKSLSEELLSNDKKHLESTWNDAVAVVFTAPTIIPAEDGEA